MVEAEQIWSKTARGEDCGATFSRLTLENSCTLKSRECNKRFYCLKNIPGAPGVSVGCASAAWVIWGGYHTLSGVHTNDLRPDLGRPEQGFSLNPCGNPCALVCPMGLCQRRHKQLLNQPYFQGKGKISALGTFKGRAEQKGQGWEWSSHLHSGVYGTAVTDPSFLNIPKIAIFPCAIS